MASTSVNPGKTITLKTSDKHLIEVEQSVAMEFATVKSFIEDDSDFAENAAVAIPLPNVSKDVLNKVITYCRKHVEFRANSTPTKEVKSFDSDFVAEESTEMIMQMLLAANYLEVKDLLDLMEDTVAVRIKNKSVEYVRKLFGIENDFTPEEEEALRQEHAWSFEGVDDTDD